MNLNLLIKNIHVIDPKNNVDGPMDLLIRSGKIVELKRAWRWVGGGSVVAGLVVLIGFSYASGQHKVLLGS